MSPIQTSVSVFLFIRITVSFLFSTETSTVPSLSESKHVSRGLSASSTSHLLTLIHHHPVEVIPSWVLSSTDLICLTSWWWLGVIYSGYYPSLGYGKLPLDSSKWCPIHNDNHTSAALLRRSHLSWCCPMMKLLWLQPGHTQQLLTINRIYRKVINLLLWLCKFTVKSHLAIWNDWNWILPSHLVWHLMTCVCLPALEFVSPCIEKCSSAGRAGPDATNWSFWTEMTWMLENVELLCSWRSH